MKKMKAIVIRQYGGPEVMNLEELPVPKPDDDELLIRVHACGVNPADWIIRSGKRHKFQEPFSYIPGFDFSGVVEATGTDVLGFKVGDAVYGFGDGWGYGKGSYAEYLVCKSNAISYKPKSLDFTESAALPVVACTAWSALFDVGQLSRDQSILIHGAGGGVGHVAVQFAKWKGAYVVGTASGYNESFLKELGVDLFINYRTSKFEDVVQDIDIVLDCIVREAQDEIDSVAANTLTRSFRVLKKGGILVSIAGSAPKGMASEYGVREAFASAEINTKRLAKIAEVVDAGFVMPHIHEVFSLDDVGHAHTLSQSGHIRGKIVLQIGA